MKKFMLLLVLSLLTISSCTKEGLELWDELTDRSGWGSLPMDADHDGVMNNVDLCPNTPNGESVDSNGCSPSQLTVQLIAPDNNAVLDNGANICSNLIEWFFDWNDIPSAQKYHLFVKGRTAINPVIDNENISISEFSSSSYSYIVNRNIEGWTWKVRAMVNGVWTDWSEIRTFDAEPLNTDCN